MTRGSVRVTHHGLSVEGRVRADLLAEIVRLSPTPTRGPKSPMIARLFAEWCDGSAEWVTAPIALLRRYRDVLVERRDAAEAKTDDKGYVWARSFAGGRAHGFPRPGTDGEAVNPRARCGASARGRYSQLKPVEDSKARCMKCLDLMKSDGRGGT